LDDGGNLEDEYEQRLSKRKRHDNDHDVEVRALLPIKCKEMGIIRRTVEISKCEHNNQDTISYYLAFNIRPVKLNTLT